MHNHLKGEKTKKILLSRKAIHLGVTLRANITILCQALKTISVRQTEGRAAVEVGVQASELMGSQEASI